MTEILLAPQPRLPQTKGVLFLVGSTDRPREEGTRRQGIYVPVWHLVKWKRRDSPPWRFMKEDRERDRPWDLFSSWNFEERLWAWVARCGARKGWPLPLLTYGTPTCRRCLKLAR